jgi:hypothetical protein
VILQCAVDPAPDKSNSALHMACLVAQCGTGSCPSAGQEQRNSLVSSGVASRLRPRTITNNAWPMSCLDCWPVLPRTITNSAWPMSCLDCWPVLPRTITNSAWPMSCLDCRPVLPVRDLVPSPIMHGPCPCTASTAPVVVRPVGTADSALQRAASSVTHLIQKQQCTIVHRLEICVRPP